MLLLTFTKSSCTNNFLFNFSETLIPHSTLALVMLAELAAHHPQFISINFQIFIRPHSILSLPLVRTKENGIMKLNLVMIKMISVVLNGSIMR